MFGLVQLIRRPTGTKNQLYTKPRHCLTCSVLHSLFTYFLDRPQGIAVTRGPQLVEGERATASRHHPPRVSTLTSGRSTVGRSDIRCIITTQSRGRKWRRGVGAKRRLAQIYKPIKVVVHAVLFGRGSLYLRLHCVESSQSWYSVKHFWHVSLVDGLILELLCSPIGNQNFRKKTRHMI